MKALVTLALAATLAACATPPQGPQSRAEWEAQHVRQFVGKSPDEVIAAAERVLLLADHDFTFDYADGGLLARREWSTYAVIAAARGVDHWKLTTQPTPEGTRATVAISRESESTSMSPIIGAGGAAAVMVGTDQQPGRPIQASEPYNLFWARVEHQLGLLPVWFTCDAFKNGRSARERGALNVLCSVNTDDRSPVE